MTNYIKTDSADYIEVPLPDYADFASLKYKNRLEKAWFFLLNEGLPQTLRKYKSIQFEKKIATEQKIVVCKFAIGDRNYVGIGRQLYDDKLKKFHPNMVFRIKSDCHFEVNDFVINQEILQKVSTYLPVDECPLDIETPALIILQHPFLEPHQLDVKNGLVWQPRKVVNENSNKVFIYGFGAYARVFSLRCFSDRINSIVDYNRNNLTAYKNANKVSFFEDYRDSLPYYKISQKPMAILSTYHSSHFEIAKMLFNTNSQGKVFIEKPIVVRFADAVELIELRKRGFWFEAGYNRRYIDWTREIQGWLRKITSPKFITMSVKELNIPRNHWYYWPNQGTRITGNLSHWIDLSYYWIKSKPQEMTLLSSNDSVNLTISFKDGSVVNIMASDIGNSLRGVQEKIQIRAENKTIDIDDYKRMSICENGKTIVKRKLFRDKGHDTMYKEFSVAMRKERSPHYENDDVFWVSYLIEKASHMFLTRTRYSEVDVDYR